MKILVTNDDGVEAQGLAVLAGALKEIAEIYVAAPCQEQSGVGHGLTVHLPIRARTLSWPGIAEKVWAISGTPADCVKLALEALMPCRPDLVVSGINHGPNLGTDIIYSGTVAGAMEGYLNGVTSIAISVTGSARRQKSGNFPLAGKVAAEYCQKLYRAQLPNRMLLNINVPGDRDDQVKGIVNAPMGWRWYTDAYDHRVDPMGKDYYWLQGQLDDPDEGLHTDVEMSNAGYITVTPLQFNLTDREALRRMDEGQLF